MSQRSSEIEPVKSTMSEPTSDQNQPPSIEEKIEKVKIILDNPENTYCSGQTIRGTISLNCTQKMQIRGIYFRVIGYGKCYWTDLLRRDSIPVDKKNDKSDIKFWGDEEYLNATVYVIGSKNGRPFPLFKGTTSYNFSFSLNTNIPSSFSGDCGKIKYKMEFVIDKPWKFDEKHVVVLNVIKRTDLNSSVECLKPFEKQLTKSVGFIDSGPISLHVFVPKLGYLSDEVIPIQATVSNNSKVRVERIKFALYKIIEYHSMSPSLAIKKVIERLIKREDNGVDKKTEQKFVQSIDVPLTPPTQDSTTSKLIHIKYELKVEVKLGTLYKNLSITVPITVGNVPYIIEEQGQAILRSNIPQEMSMPRDSSFSRSSVFSNWSTDLYPQIGDRSSISIPTPYSASSPVAIMPNSTIGSSMSSNPSFGMLSITPLPSISTVSSMSPVSPASILSSNFTQDRPLSLNYPPSAPPMDFHSMNSSTPIRPHSLFVNRPPSYDEVYGHPAQMNQFNTSNTPPSHNATTKS